jgi:hypothetical protein
MFNMLNMLACKGKKSPLVCNFFDTWTAFLDISFPALQALFYLIERTGLRKCSFQPIGLRIAFAISRRAFVRILTERHGRTHGYRDQQAGSSEGSPALFESRGGAQFRAA